MKLSFARALFIAACLSLWAKVGLSEDNAGSLDAHVHGVSEILIAIEGKEIEIRLESPAMNLVGFEHQAKTEQDKATVNRAVATLKKHRSIFSFSASQCKLVDASVDVSSVLKMHSENEENHHSHGDEHEKDHRHEDKHEHEKEHGHEDKHEHEKEHAQEDKHDHEEKHGHEDKHEHEHGHDESATHSEIYADYHFSCEDIDKLTTIEVSLFEHFPGIHQIRALWVSETKQGAVSLDSNNKTIGIR